MSGALRLGTKVGVIRGLALPWSAPDPFRLNDRVNVRDMIDVGLVDQSWTSRLPDELAARLQQLLDNPDG